MRAKKETIDLALQAVYKGAGKGKWSFGKGQHWNEKGGKGAKDGGKSSWQNLLLASTNNVRRKIHLLHGGIGNVVFLSFRKSRRR